MTFLLGQISKLREIEDLVHEINELSIDENRTTNTDSRSRLFYERKRKMQELMHDFIAEEAAFTRSNPRAGRILIGVPNQHAGNIHEYEEYVL